jgi:hypothetical protein
MGLLDEARLARLRGYKVAQKSGSMKTALAGSKTSSWGTSDMSTYRMFITGPPQMDFSRHRRRRPRRPQEFEISFPQQRQTTTREQEHHHAYRHD